jgi:hypothetical protein
MESNTGAIRKEFSMRAKRTARARERGDLRKLPIALRSVLLMSLSLT